jgi:glutathione S-transferase
MATKCTLFGETLWISPYFFSSFVALREKGIPFEIVEVDLAHGSHLQAEYRDASLTARIPSLQYNGFRLSESSAIAEYLEEMFPAPNRPRLFPEDVRERARARQLMAWLRSDVDPIRAERASVFIFYTFPLPPLSPAAMPAVEKLLRVADQLIPADCGPLFGAWCLADSELAFMLQRLIRNGQEVPARLRDYAERQWQRPSVRAFAEHARPLDVPSTYWAFSGTPRPASA